VNTLLPFADFSKSAECLDDRRLGKQRADVINILKALTEPPPEDGVEHAAVKMWRGNEQTLIQYGIIICLEYKSRDNTDNSMNKINAFRKEFPASDPPEWLGDEAFHLSHQSFLLRSQPTHYRQFWPDAPDDLATVWPRSPEKQRTTADDKNKQKLITKAKKMKERAEAAIADAHDAAIKAGLDPDTLEPISEVEAEEELAAL
jgi:hypothetical protein